MSIKVVENSRIKVCLFTKFQMYIWTLLNEINAIWNLALTTDICQVASMRATFTGKSLYNDEQ